MARKRKEPEESGGGYNWMDTYGDLVTLLLCFFVLLYSFSSIDSQKWQELVNAFSGSGSSATVMELDPSSVMASPIPTVEGSKSEEDRQNAIIKEQNEEFDQLYNNIKGYIEENQLSGQLEVERTGDVILLRFVEAVLFESGKADILSEGKPILDHIIKIINENVGVVAMIRIEGHTDNLPIHNFRFHDNWELSVARAVSALEYVLGTNHIAPEKLSAGGYGEYHPVETNETAAGRAKNRRVDFVIEKVTAGKLTSIS